MKTFNFTGLMAPVFTPYTNGNETLNLQAIEPYVELLKANRVKGVLVNGTSGEGMLLTVAERMLVTEAWQSACKKHAETLVSYLKSVAKHCPTIPFFYYHIPMFTDVNVHMPTFLNRAEQEIGNFRGIKYTSGDLEQGSACLKDGRTIFLGADTILCGAVAAGFDSFIMTTLNICPETAFEIITDVNRGAVQDAREKQRKLNAHIATILQHGDWVSAMKKAFIERFPSIEVGHTRPPLNA
uniref:N-acetylneuraminate lyase n=1 Tax=Anopheles stephensi TaxID=30069 RepID=A0A182XZC7_ANOST